MEKGLGGGGFKSVTGKVEDHLVSHQEAWYIKLKVIKAGGAAAGK